MEDELVYIKSKMKNQFSDTEIILNRNLSRSSKFFDLIYKKSMLAINSKDEQTRNILSQKLDSPLTFAKTNLMNKSLGQSFKKTNMTFSFQFK